MIYKYKYNKMKFIIFGGGPCGMRMADNLSSKNHEVILCEREKKLGGCWKVDWDRGYYREHAPRVMSTNYSKTLEHIKTLGLQEPVYKEIYGGNFKTKNMFLKFFYKNLSFYDLSMVIISLTTIRKSDKRTVKEWLEDKNISEKGRKAFRIFSLTLATTPDKLSVGVVFEAIRDSGGSNFIQLTGGEDWILKWEENLSKRVKIKKNTELISLEVDKNNVVSAKTNKSTMKADFFICCIPLYSLLHVLEKSSSYNLKNNWDNFKKFKKFCYDSSYSGFGFQLQFTDIQELSNEWCKECTGDWNIIVNRVSKYLNVISKKEIIKDVWSCVIVDTNAKSSYLNKSVNQIIDKEAVFKEAVRQLSESLGREIIPYKITLSEGVFYDKKSKWWDMRQTAYGATPVGYLTPKGKKIKNLAAVGCYNIFEISVLEGAFKSADKFTETF